MEPGSESNDGGKGKQGVWTIIGCASLTGLAIFWTVDPSFVYFFLAIAAFSLFKVIQLWQRQVDESDSNRDVRQSFTGERHEYRPSQTWILWQQVKDVFRNKATTGEQRGKIFVALVAGFIGFIFLITILSAIFGGNATDDLDELYRATDYYNRQQYDSAAYFYKLAIAKDPENASLYFERGNAFLNSEKTDSALMMYDEALAREPQHYQSQYNKGYIYFNRKSYRQAIDETKKIMSYNPDYTDAMLLIGDSFYNQSQLDSALQWYEGAYSNGYRSAVLCHLMAYIYDTKGNTATAINLYKEAIGQDSTIKDIYVRLGELVQGAEGNRYRLKASQMQ